MVAMSNRMTQTVIYSDEPIISSVTSSQQEAEAAQVVEYYGPSVMVAVPAYNEARFIGSLVIQLCRYFSVVLVIDDGSTDDTAQVAKAAGALVVSHETNKGKGEGVNTAFRLARESEVEALVLLDGDGQHRVDDALTALQAVLHGGADMVVGSRYLGTKSEMPMYRVIGQQALNAVTNAGSGVVLSDSQSGLRAFSQRAISLLSFSSHGFSVESEMQFLMNTHQLNTAEVPITTIYCEAAKRSPLKQGMEVISGIVTLASRRRPLLLLGGLGIASVMGGLAIGLYTMLIYNQSQTLAIGYALITVLLLTLGVVAAFAGLMLNSLTSMMQGLQDDLKLVSEQMLPPLIANEVKQAHLRRVDGTQRMQVTTDTRNSPNQRNASLLIGGKSATARS